MPTTKASKPASNTAPKIKSEKPAVVEVKKEIVSVKYHNKNLKISPRKLRAILPSVKALAPAEALKRLGLTNTNAARIMAKSVQTIIADSKNNYHLNPYTLKFDTIRVDEGMKIKRMDKSHGSRFARGIRIKRHSRLEIIVKGETK